MAGTETVELSCPICLASSRDDVGEGEDKPIFVRTPCGHVFRSVCLERVLLAEPPRGPRHGPLPPPARGRCPISRRDICLFDAVVVTEDGVAGPLCAETDPRSWPVAGRRYRRRPLRPSPGADEALAAAATARGAAGGHGVEFAFDGPRPSLRFEPPLRATGDGDGEGGPAGDLDAIEFGRVQFHRGAFFRGGFAFEDPVRLAAGGPSFDRLECLLQFSGGGHYVRRGGLRWRLAPSPSPADHPLDGNWEVLYPTRPGGGTLEVGVRGHRFLCHGLEFRIELDDGGRPHFAWPGMSVVQRSQQRVSPRDGDSGAVSTIEWETDHRDYEKIVWKRRGGPSDEWWETVDVSVGEYAHRRSDGGRGDGGPTYRPGGLWGNVYCQMFAVGLASYHFLEPDPDGTPRAYISYESPLTEAWPALDNGERAPPRAYFRNASWDEAQRTFRGDICWKDDHGAAWMGDSKWSYEMVFDRSYTFIASGTCRRSEGQVSQFGTTLMYINAGLEAHLRTILPNQTPGQYLDIVRGWRDNGASEGTLQNLGEIAMSVMGNRGNVIDMNV